LEIVKDFCSDFRFSIKKSIVEKAENIIETFTKGDPYLSISFRGTDFPGASVEKITQRELLPEINSTLKVFVCSDEKRAEEIMLDLLGKRGFRHQKKEYVEKIYQEEGWRGQTKLFNVDRSSISVVEAVVDLLIMSKSQKHNTLFGNSTSFLNLANFMRGGLLV